MPIKRKTPAISAILGDNSFTRVLDALFAPDDVGIDPTSGVLDTVASPLVSIFRKTVDSVTGEAVPKGKGMLNKLGEFVSPAGNLLKEVPDIEARKLATDTFVEAGREMSPAMGHAAEFMAKRYPRVAAHTRLNPIPIDDYDSSGMQVLGHAKTSEAGYPNRMAGYPVPVEITEHGIKKTGGAPATEFVKAIPPTHTRFQVDKTTQGFDEARDLLAHEMTHVAQRLGNRHFNDLYAELDRLVGYQENPFEVTARMRGEAAKHAEHRVELPQVMRRTDAVQKHSEALQKLTPPWDKGEHGALMRDIMFNLLKEAGHERLNATKMIQRLILDPVGKGVDPTQYQGSLDFLRKIMEHRGTMALPKHPPRNLR